MSRYVGIEITEHKVRAVSLRTAFRLLEIEAVVTTPRSKSPESLVQALATTIAALPRPTDGVFVSIPGTDVSLRVLEIPKVLARRGARVLATELEGSLPYEVDDAVLDAQTIRDADPVELLAAGTRRDRLRATLDALRSAGVEAREVGIPSASLAELFRHNSELTSGSPVLVIHAHDDRADIAIIAGTVVHAARTLTGQNNPNVRLRELRQTLGAYLAGGGLHPVSAIVCGESSWLFPPDLVARAAEIAPESVRTGIPLGRIKTAPTVVPTDPQNAPVALALALRGIGGSNRIDLRRGEREINAGAEVLREKAPFLLGCAAAIVVSWGFATYARYRSVAAERDRLVNTLGIVTKEVFNEKITDPERAKAFALGQGPELDPLPEADALDVIGVLSQSIDPSIKHDLVRLDINDEHIALEGIVDLVGQRDQIVESLSSYQCFPTVNKGNVARTSQGDRQQYSLDIEFRCPGRASTKRTNRLTTGTTRPATTGSKPGNTNGGGNGP